VQQTSIVNRTCELITLVSEVGFRMEDETRQLLIRLFSELKTDMKDVKTDLNNLKADMNDVKMDINTVYDGHKYRVRWTRGIISSRRTSVPPTWAFFMVFRQSFQKNLGQYLKLRHSRFLPAFFPPQYSLIILYNSTLFSFSNEKSRR
jgi:hypothetical protein